MQFEYYLELTLECKVLDAGDYLLLAGLPIPWTFFCMKEKFQILQKVVLILS